MNKRGLISTTTCYCVHAGRVGAYGCQRASIERVSTKKNMVIITSVRLTAPTTSLLKLRINLPQCHYGVAHWRIEHPIKIGVNPVRYEV